MKIFLLVLSIYLNVIFATAQNKSISFKCYEGKVYFVSNKEQVLFMDQLDWVGERVNNYLSLPNKYTIGIANGAAVIRKGGAFITKLNLNDLTNTWLNQDEFWGGHKNANQLKYMHQKAGGLEGSISNLVYHHGNVYAIASWRALGPSIQYVSAQQIIQITLNQIPEIKFISTIDPSLYNPYSYAATLEVPRLFEFSNKLYLFTESGNQDRLLYNDINSNNLTFIKSEAILKSNLRPVGYVGSRWIILITINSEVSKELYAYDLKAHRIKEIKGNWNGVVSPTYITTNQTSNRFTVVQWSNKMSKCTDYVVKLPSGTRKAVLTSTSSYNLVLWKHYIITENDKNTILVYDINTNRKLKSYSPFPQKTLTKLKLNLLNRLKIDQDIRDKFLAAKAQSDILKYQKQMHSIDIENTQWMHRVISKFGWPNAQMVTNDGAQAAFVLIQHADQDLQFQKKCLPLLQNAAEAGRAKKSDVALLTDRVLSNEGKPQRYGTQWIKNDKGELKLKPMENPENVDVRRKSMGLSPMAEYKKMLESIYK